MEIVILAAVLVAVALLAVLIVLVIRSSAGSGGDDRVQARQLAAFSQASQQALAGQSQQFLQLAETRYGALNAQTAAMLGGHGERINEALDALAGRLSALERERSDATSSLASMVRELAVANRAARDETAQLRSALRDGRVRGAWGEVQLRRVLELSGMMRHLDFVEQSTSVANNSVVRPDVVVHLPNGRNVVIDAKAPLDRYLEAVASDEPEMRSQLLAGHAKAVAAHVSALSGRRYSEHVDGAVDMVIMFLPGEPFLSAALDADPSLFEVAAAKGVVLTTPSSLLTLLRGIAEGWRERSVSEQAAEIQQLGAELHERVARFLESYALVGQRLNQATDAYNRSVGSAQSRLLVSARRLADHGAGSARSLPDIGEVLAVARTPRSIDAIDADGGSDAVDVDSGGEPTPLPLDAP